MNDDGSLPFLTVSTRPTSIPPPSAPLVIAADDVKVRNGSLEKRERKQKPVRLIGEENLLTYSEIQSELTAANRLNTDFMSLHFSSAEINDMDEVYLLLLPNPVLYVHDNPRCNRSLNKIQCVGLDLNR
ncbi:hypothetical protein OUZ56_007027 [Daphnia magna]|uniref:Uncharacterized protein n=1 Tax=Daphnia magna TaxID=35525 RepID=A0ABQ9YXD3_9CRUS|nr:hypothetical protein OUZ56_007027 [Daphnia magna]